MFTNKKTSPTMSSRRRLDRRNAAKNIDYSAAGTLSAAASFSTSDDDIPSPDSLRATKSLDISPVYRNQTSFRIGGSIEGEVDLICRSLGLSGPEDFAISADAWEASRAQRSSSDSLPKSRLSPQSREIESKSEAIRASENTSNNNSGIRGVSSRTLTMPGTNVESGMAKSALSKIAYNQESGGGIEVVRVSENHSNNNGLRGVRPLSLTMPDTRVESSAMQSTPNMVSKNQELESRNEVTMVSENISGNSGIRGVRPPTLATPEISVESGTVKSAPLKSGHNPSPSSVLAPPPSMSLPKENKIQSVWDLVKSFAPNEDEDVKMRDVEDENDKEEFVMTNKRGRYKWNIGPWMKGRQLGSGSFGTVYEAINDTGNFFAVKEVSLLDQGGNAQQCILQLEQEIALLSRFEHENIVQYYGTDKEEAKLFIFIEYASQGSLASLYQKYRLQDSHVSAYTRQILKGLNYLHEQNIVHRDIKCANILVHANGSVKLADFGLAKQMSKLNELKSCKGSVYWMAPEVVKPKKPYGPSADIWSLGCAVLEMLTQQLPYPDMEWIHVLFKVGKGESPPIPDNLSIDARDFIAQCVQSNPANRPTAAQLLEHPFVKRPLPSLCFFPSQ